MSDNRDDIWVELQARAERALEHPKDLDVRETIRRYGSLWRLWRFPSVGVLTAWTVLMPGRKTVPGAPPRVREVTWDRPADNQRLFGPEPSLAAQPTLRVRDALLPPDELQRFIDAGASIAVPLLAFSKAAPVDEDLFGLETYEVSPYVRLQWWGEGPQQWRPFLDWVAGLRVFLGRHLDEAS
ncbi:MAG TPA: hypothetical protein VEL76_33700 [Gemmataceae bacterium]|nr:hypothetical protein [Gemmataceae bacterium]